MLTTLGVEDPKKSGLGVSGAGASTSRASASWTPRLLDPHHRVCRVGMKWELNNFSRLGLKVAQDDGKVPHYPPGQLSAGELFFRGLVSKYR